MLYSILYKFFECFQTKKLAANTTSMLHAASAVIIKLFGTSDLFFINTTGYFFYDIIYILINENINLMNILYLYHHLACLYYMTLDPKIFNWFNILPLGEFGNLPNYVVYYYLKTDKNNKKIKFWKILQKIVYTIVRIPIGGFLLSYELSDQYKIYKLLPIGPLYLLGIIWSIAILYK